MSENPILQLDSVSVTYPGGYQAVNEISFSLSHGERIGIVGESGSGKSTL
ncbi:MAG: ATP-binding cassette domain-containing protein, partial [Puniceicoccales bacterium]